MDGYRGPEEGPEAPQDIGEKNGRAKRDEGTELTASELLKGSEKLNGLSIGLEHLLEVRNQGMRGRQGTQGKLTVAAGRRKQASEFVRENSDQVGDRLESVEVLEGGLGRGLPFRRKGGGGWRARRSLR